MKVDILVFAAHPDDAELSCAGAIIKSIKQGKKVAVVDLTRGELGSRGTPETRKDEAEKSAEILGLSARQNAGLPDGFFKNSREEQLRLIEYIRKYQPEIVLGNAPYDRHPDHGRAHNLIKESCFYSGLAKIDTILNNQKQPPWRPKQLFYFIQNNYMEPDFVLDITEEWDQKLESILAYKTQFYNPKQEGPETFISSKRFIEFIESRAKEMGNKIAVSYGEGFMSESKPGLNSLFDLRI